MRSTDGVLPARRRVWAGALVLASFGLALGSPAWAAQQTLTRSFTRLDPGSADTGTFGVPPVRSGSLVVRASRAADGRIAVRVRARVVMARAVLGQLELSPCNAAINPAALPAPGASVPAPIWTFSGRSVTVVRQLHKGANDVRLSATVSSDDRWTPVPRHWTDCVEANLIDQTETDRRVIEREPGDVTREGGRAFVSTPVILSVTDGAGQHS